MALFLDILRVLIGVVIGGVAGFFIARNYMKKYMKQNPPINEQMIKAMMTQMGRTPSQKQVNQMMKTMKALLMILIQGKVNQIMKKTIITLLIKKLKFKTKNIIPQYIILNILIVSLKHIIYYLLITNVLFVMQI